MGGAQRLEMGKWDVKSCSDVSGYICSRAVDPLIGLNSTEIPKHFTKLGNSFYMIVQTNLTWKDAQDHCVGEGAKLASIREAFTQSYVELMTYEIRQPLWIGLNSMETDGYFQWIDKWELNMESWAPNEPNMDYPCAYVDVNGMWKTAQCNQTFYSLCKKSTVQLPPTKMASTVQALRWPKIVVQRECRWEYWVGVTFLKQSGASKPEVSR
ncbi:hypothetical protein NFI96_005397 [Prochilodus magdalenae]|nr:hypothetical protein NFI96_005397 [Prochilodus magdalenae]